MSSLGDCAAYAIPAGESNKNAETWMSILGFLAENRFTRTDAVVALGGGVTGDLAGFAAACYLRGIDVIQCPTTLLAMTDSCLGGKTGFDLPQGKNLVGAFHMPSAVFADTAVLSTLPACEFRAGCGELAKYAVLIGGGYAKDLEENGDRFDRETVIADSLRYKASLAERDPYDRGGRRLLNLGHTVGHAVESLSDYRIPHGEAVGIGLGVIARASAAAGKCSASCADRIVGLLKKLNLSTECGYTPEQLLYAAGSDKKKEGAVWNIVTVRDLGHCEVETMEKEALRTFLRGGLV